MIRIAPNPIYDKLVEADCDLTGGDSRARLGLPGAGAIAAIADLRILRPDPLTRELTGTRTSRKTIMAKSGWPLRAASDCLDTSALSEEEPASLRDLTKRAARAHGVLENIP